MRRRRKDGEFVTTTQTIEPQSVLPYHVHDHAYIAVVSKGGYVEAGESGRFHVGEGWAIFHPPFQPHFNRVTASGARILNLSVNACTSLSPWAGELHDISRVISLAARDPDAAVEEIVATAGRRAPSIEDWPDLLAIALGADAVGRIGDWALGMGLSAEGVSRGFQRCYGASPSRFQADARARRALTTVISGGEPLAIVAQDHGYCDQAHMTRAITKLTGRPPGVWRRGSGCWPSKNIDGSRSN